MTEPIEHRHASVVIIGGGPGGYVAGIRCGQLGLDTVVVDDQPPGGTCLNVGCIPSKALIHAADEYARVAGSGGLARLGISAAAPAIDLATTVAWKDGIVERLNRGVAALLDKAGTSLLAGRASLVDGKTCEIVASDGTRSLLTTDHIVLATGSVPVELAALPFGDHGSCEVISSTGALALQEVPRALVVVGGGYIGIELGTAFAKLGTEVTIVEATGQILPRYDADLIRPVVRRLAELDVTVLTGATAEGLADGGLVVAADAGRRTLPAEKVLVTVGRRPCTDGLGLERVPLTLDGPFVAVDEQCRTSMRHVWAIGDLTGEPMLAHRAMMQGEVVAAAIAEQPVAFDPRAVPAIVFSDPEIVTVGLSPAEAEAEHGDVVVGSFPLSANGRSMTLDSSTGFVRVVARADDHLIVGVQAVGPTVAELSAGFTLAIEMAARLEDLTGTIHAHPTVSEALAEAAHAALGHGLHR